MMKGQKFSLPIWNAVAIVLYRVTHIQMALVKMSRNEKSFKLDEKPLCSRFI